MTTKAMSTRRLFFSKAGAALSAPLAVATASASREDSEALEMRLAMLEEIDAIRELHQTYARLINAQAHKEIVALFADPTRAQIDTSIRNVSSDHFAQQDVIDVATDHKTATARIHCRVQVETPIGPSCPLVEMARQQGDGVVRRAEKRVLESDYVKRGGVWKIERMIYRENA